MRYELGWSNPKFAMRDRRDTVEDVFQLGSTLEILTDRLKTSSVSSPLGWRFASSLQCF
jgi:hypothetical protein